MERIIIKATVAAKRHKVWDYYTHPIHITGWNFADVSWHCPRANSDLKVGGRYLARMEAGDGSFGFDFDAVYTEIQQGEFLTYKFGGRYATVEFISQGEKTNVIVTFDPEAENPLEIQKAVWQAILKNFKSYTEGN